MGGPFIEIRITRPWELIEPTTEALRPRLLDWQVDAKADYTGNAVKVMNLTSNGGRISNQDQLVYVGVPDGGTTALLLGLGFLSLAMVKRKQRQA